MNFFAWLGSMGKLDIQVVPIPWKELMAWWKDMTKDNQVYVQDKLGDLLDLIHVEHQVSLIQAMAYF